MHFNKPQNDEFLHHNDKTFIKKYTTTADIASETAKTTTPTATSSSFLINEAASAKQIRSPTIQASEKLGTFTGTTTSSCTSSTDSGVNISDNETTITPSPSPAPLSPTINPFNQEFNKNNNKISNNDKNNKINNFNDDDDGDVNGKKYNDLKTFNNSTNFDNKLTKTKSEEAQNRRQPHHTEQGQSAQQFIKVENGGNEKDCNNTPLSSYQNKNRNAIKSENVINISHHPSAATAMAFAKEAATTTMKNDLSSPLHHHHHHRQQQPPPGNEFVDPLQQRSSSQSSLSLSSSSTSNSHHHHQQHHPPSNMHHNGSPVVSIRSIDSSVIDSDSDSDLSDEFEGEHENYVIKKLGTQVSYPPRHPEIPNINKGLTVLNQHVTQNGRGGQVPPSPIAALTAIGDNFSVAQGLGGVPSPSAVAQRPQIGSIALSNSSDVTFGDKHFYEGPVTIQQFLIDGRDKFKENNGKENPSFENTEGGTLNNGAKDIKPSTTQSSKLYGYVSKRKKYIIPGVLTFMTLLIVAIILGSEALSDSKSKLVLGNSEESRKNIPINSTIDTNSDDNVDDNEECNGNNGTLCLIDRDVWRAHLPTQELDKHKELPVHRAIISHTASEPCDSVIVCSERVRIIQEFHMNSFKWDDIGYNFLITSDGRVYVGRGWDVIGAHTKGYNTDSVGITFIGTYTTIQPTEAQLNACRLLLEEGVRLKKLDPNYRLYGARQLGATESPGEMLYKIIKKWPHWTVNVS